MARPEQHVVQAADGADVGAEAARQRLVARLGAPVHALAGSLGGAGQRRAEHHRVGAKGERLDEAAGIAHAAVRDHLHVSTAGLVHVVAARLGDVRDGGGHRRVHADRVAVGGDRAAAEADKHAGSAGAHQMQGRGVVGRAADDDRHVKIVDELLQVQRLMVLGDMLGGHDGAADHEQVDAGLEHGGIVVLGALRGQRAGDGDARVADLVETLDDELRLDRLGVDLLDARGRLVRRQLRDLVEQRLRIVIAGPQALEVEHAERAHPAQGDGGGRAGHRIHRGADDRHVEFIGVDLPRGGHILRIASTTGGNDGDVVQRVSQTALLAQTDFNFLRHGSKANAQL